MRSLLERRTGYGSVIVAVERKRWVSAGLGIFVMARLRHCFVGAPLAMAIGRGGIQGKGEAPMDDANCLPRQAGQGQNELSFLRSRAELRAIAAVVPTQPGHVGVGCGSWHVPKKNSA